MSIAVAPAYSTVAVTVARILLVSRHLQRPTCAVPTGTHRPSGMAIVIACRWPGADGATLVFSAQGPDHGCPRDLTKLLWLQGVLERHVFDNKHDAAAWTNAGLQMMPRGVQIPLPSSCSDRAVQLLLGSPCRFFNLSTHRGLERLFSALRDSKGVGRMHTRCFSSLAAALSSVMVAAPSSSTSPSPSMVCLQVQIASSASHRSVGIVQALASLGRDEGRPWARPPPPVASYSFPTAITGVGVKRSRAEGSSGRGGWRVPGHRRPIDRHASLIVSILEGGESVFVIGIAGSGKTTILKKVMPLLEMLDPRMGVCATTGVPASLLGGVTLHSWLGLVPEVVLAVASELDVEVVVA